MNANVLIALLLFLATSVAGYAVWYIVRGRRRRRGAPGAAAAGGDAVKAPAQAHREAPQKGYSRDAYCYPAINDMMGYEFVSVVKVDAALTGAAAPAPEEAPRRDWSQSRGIGLTAVPTEERRDENDPALPDERPAFLTDGRSASLPPAPPAGGPPRSLPAPPAPEDDDQTEEESSINAEDLEQLDRMTSDWSSRENDQQYDDEAWDAIIRQNPGMVETLDEEDGGEGSSAAADESSRIAREQEALRRIMMMNEEMDRNADTSAEVHSIMELLGDDTEGDGGAPEPDDIPEI